MGKRRADRKRRLTLCAQPDATAVRNPRISRNATGGPERKTEIVTLGSGYEERNAVWANSRHAYQIGYGIKDLDDLYTVQAFFEARMGRLYGFRFKDYTDYLSCAPLETLSATDQSIGTGDGSTTQFQLIKTYTSGDYSYERTITKPVSDTVVVAVGGTEVTDTWAVDTTTGIITFDTAPDADDAITAGFEFDVPVRFGTDTLSLSLTDFNAGEIPDISLIEVRI